MGIRSSLLRENGHLREFSSTATYLAARAIVVPPDYDPNSIANLYAQYNPLGSGSTWADAKGGAGTGTLANGAAWGSGAVQFDGSNDEVNGFTNIISPAVGSGGRTLCLWATSTDSSFARRGLIGTRSSGGGDGFFFGYRDSSSMFYAIIGGTNWTPTITMPAANTANFWALTHNAATTTVTLYLNGTQVAQLTSFTSTDTAPFSFKGVIGSEQESQTSEHWQGSIKRALVYTRALTGAEITTLNTNLT